MRDASVVMTLAVSAEVSYLIVTVVEIAYIIISTVTMAYVTVTGIPTTYIATIARSAKLSAITVTECSITCLGLAATCSSVTIATVSATTG